VSKFLSLLAVLALASLQPAYAAPTVADGFIITQIATIPGARELSFAPNGDLFVGTSGSDVYIVPNADAPADPPEPHVFAHFNDAPAAGVTVADGSLYVGTQFAVWRVPYAKGDQHARSAPQKLAPMRTSGVARGHSTTSVAFSKGVLFASAGSSCNACQPDLDGTRATIGRVENGTYMIVASRVRNAIALTVNPNTGSLWTGVAGEDDLPVGHPYEIFDNVSAHAQPVTYGWPYCYENQKTNPVRRWSGHSCAGTAVPRVVFPAYETPIGAAFYPAHPHGRYAFPASYAGGAFITLHGSWHGPAQGLSGYVPPRVVFVPMHGDTPARSADWSNPNTQWTEFISGYQQGGTAQRIGRPTGVAIGPEGDLFVADDDTGAIYRIRPR
jgi:glucose/arabinose dehydrogenase